MASQEILKLVDILYKTSVENTELVKMKEELQEDIRNVKSRIAAKLQKLKLQLARKNEEKCRLEAYISVLQNEHQRLVVDEVILEVYLYFSLSLLVQFMFHRGEYIHSYTCCDDYFCVSMLESNSHNKLIHV